ncbi:MAG: diguanylate cyclase, partial [Candidatus Krumholzibacteria bacterium]|nr:diguanylate cyclase [Candidatus Krumholzibacteria bacterium]
KGVQHVSEKLRYGVESIRFKVPETDITISVTISVGVSVFRGSRREFFNAADRALYLSKSEGKNRVNYALQT